jgi:hypothetical protein
MFSKSTKMSIWQGYEKAFSVTLKCGPGSPDKIYYLFIMIPFLAFPILKSDVL